MHCQNRDIDLRSRRSSNAASSPCNDSLLRTALALQQLAHVMTRCYGLTQQNVKTRTLIYQRLDRPQLTHIKHLAVSPQLDLCQLPSANVQLRTFTIRPYQLSTWPILAEDHIQPPRTFTNTFVIPAIKSSLLLYLLSCLFVLLHCLWLSLHSHALNP